MTTPDVGYMGVSGNYPVKGNWIALYKTLNCWHDTIHLWMAGDNEFYYDIKNVSFISENIGAFAWSTTRGYYIWQNLTTNGGGNWASPHYPDPIVTPNRINQIFITSPTVNYSRLDYGIYRRKNDTIIQTWDANGYIPYYCKIYFSNDSTGFFFGSGFCLRTMDWGVSWDTLNILGTDPAIITFPNSNTGYMLGTGGSLLRSVDSGITWQTACVNLGNQLNDISFLNDSVGYVVGDQGKIIQTTDYGNSWKSQFSPDSSKLLTIKVINSTDAFITTRNGNLLRNLNPGIQDDSPPLCLVSFDSAMQNNLIQWNLPTNYLAEHFNVYKLSEAGEYVKIAQIPYSLAGTWIDTTAMPNLMEASYTLTSTSSAGQESMKSNVHRTMRLEIIHSDSAGYDLHWSAYSGFEVTKYLIFQKVGSGPWTVLDTVKSTLLRYSITNYLSIKADYFVQAIKSDTCSTPTAVIKQPISNIVNHTPFLVVQPLNQEVTASGGSTAFTVSANAPWTALSDTAWCTVTPSGSGPGTIVANYSENLSNLPRVAHISVMFPDQPQSAQHVTLTQSKSTIGIETIGEKDFQIYPNPTTGVFKIVPVYLNGNKLEITVCDFNGKKIFSQEMLGRQEYEIDLSKANQGYYSLILKTNDRVMVQKLVIIR